MSERQGWWLIGRRLKEEHYDKNKGRYRKELWGMMVTMGLTVCGLLALTELLDK